MDDCRERTELYEYCSHAPVRLTRGGHSRQIGAIWRQTSIPEYVHSSSRCSAYRIVCLPIVPHLASSESTIHNVVSPQTAVLFFQSLRHSTGNSVDAQFKVAVEKIGSLPKNGPIKPSQEDQLNVSTPFNLSRSALTESFPLAQFYGLFKQANIGDVNTDRPGTFLLLHVAGILTTTE
jgi:hypothetical protein